MDKINPYNNEKRIQLLDKSGNLIRQISQREAKRLLNRGFATLLMVKSPTVQLTLDTWSESRLSNRKNKNSITVLYGSVRVQSPEGKEMFHTNSQKALWYLNRDCVDIVSENPPIIKFKFDPKGPGHIDDPYYLSEKINQCVVCGKIKKLTRHHVLPHHFRKYLPTELKDHSYHDILLLCSTCHRKYETLALNLKKDICKEMGIDFIATSTGLSTYNCNLGDATKAATALLKHRSEIPIPRQEELLNKIRVFLGKTDIIDKDLELLSVTNPYCVSNEKTYGQIIIEKINDYQGFIERWRKHFLDTMQPQYLPQNWDVTKSIERKEK